MENCIAFENDSGGISLFFPRLQSVAYIGEQDCDDWARHIRNADWVADLKFERPEDVSGIEAIDQAGKVVAEIFDDDVCLYGAVMGKSARLFFGLDDKKRIE
jgi:hypothetical protein